MGWYGAFIRPNPQYLRVFASMAKLPALFLLTLAVTFPSLYVFAALTGCRLTFTAVLRLLVAAIVVNLAVAASLAPILGFFTLSTTSYPFMILLNVVILALAGFVGLGFLLNTLRKLAAATAAEMSLPAPILTPTPSADETNPEALGQHDAVYRAARAAARALTPPPTGSSTSGS